MRLSMISNILATWVTVLAGLLGGYVALDTYMTDSRKQLDDRQKQTFELVRSYASKDMLPIRDKVLRFVMGQRNCSNETPQQLDLSDTELQAFVQFFDMVTVCVDASLCDGSLAQRFFESDANVHWPVLKGQVLAVRKAQGAMKASAPFGGGLERLAAAPQPFAECKAP